MPAGSVGDAGAATPQPGEYAWFIAYARANARDARKSEAAVRAANQDDADEANGLANRFGVPTPKKNPSTEQ